LHRRISAACDASSYRVGSASTRPLRAVGGLCFHEEHRTRPGDCCLAERKPLAFCYCTAHLHTYRQHGIKVKVMSICIAPPYEASLRSKVRYSTHCQGISQFYLHTLHFIHKPNELYLPRLSQPQLVLIYRSGGMEG